MALAEGRATVELTTTLAMAADAHDLVHGGFVFSLADHAAMLAINHPNVVLGSAETRFLQPVRVGETLVADARCSPPEGKKLPVVVTVWRRDASSQEPVFSGTFVCFTLARHVLAR